MFLDETLIKVAGGKGGDGVISFRREKYVPRGGPDGGDGGRGGHIILQVDEGLNTLAYFRNRKDFQASDGSAGRGGNKHGAQGKDLIIKVPPGTAVYNNETGALEADLKEPGQEYLLVRGGTGGKGNARFATSTNRAPRKAEKGEEGEYKEIRLELKLLAEVGLVGLPNAGKSTLLSKVSSSRPKIASYPFTTLQPMLGVVDYQEGTMVWADLPGLLEGAHKGVGLGHRFLKHIERTRVILFIIDGSGLAGHDPMEAINILEKELGNYSEGLIKRPRLLVINKADLVETRENLPAIEEELHKRTQDFCVISAATGEGLDILLEKVHVLLQEAPVPEIERPAVKKAVMREEPPYNIVRENDRFTVQGGQAQKRIERTDFSSEESVQELLGWLKHKGLYEALQEKGIKEGDTVIIGPMEFDYIE